MITVLAILFASLLIIIHEYGHYRVARACQVKVLRFSIGFGRVLWRKPAVAGGTEFVISAIPFGGYVKMLDERLQDPNDDPIDPADLPFALSRRPIWQRILVVAAGPLANLLLAVALFAAAQWLGIEEPAAVLSTPPQASLMAEAGIVAGDRVVALARGRASDDLAGDGDSAWHDVRAMGDLQWAITQAVIEHQPLRLRLVGARSAGAHDVTLPLDTLEFRDLDAAAAARIGLAPPFARPVLGQLTPDGPAARAGLRQGDEVLAVDGVPVADAQGLRERIRASGRLGAPAPMEWTVRRPDGTAVIAVQPRRVVDKGNPVGRIDAQIGAPGDRVMVRDDLLPALRAGVVRTWDTSVLTLRMIGRMLVGQASVKNLSGPLTIADEAARSAHEGLSYYLAFLAFVSVGLGVLNLLPLPVLDGGHLIYYLFEGATGRPVSELWQSWLQRGGIVILLLLMSLALSNDVVRMLGQ